MVNVSSSLVVALNGEANGTPTLIVIGHLKKGERS